MTFPCIKCKIHKYTNMQIQKYKVVKRTKAKKNLYFLKARDSRISIMTFPCIKCEIHKYTNTHIHKYKKLEDPTCAVFFKSMILREEVG